MQANQTPIVWTVIICTVLLAIVGFFAASYVANQIPEAQEIVMPTSGEIAALVLANVDIPTATEIAAEIDTPDTFYSVMDDKESVAEGLATEHLNDDDFREKLAKFLRTNDCDGDCNIGNINENDIESIRVVGDVDVNGYGAEREVTIMARVIFEEDNEEEEVKVEIVMTVTDLDREDDYEDAEVQDNGPYPYDFDFIKCYNNFC